MNGKIGLPFSVRVSFLNAKRQARKPRVFLGLLILALAAPAAAQEKTSYFCIKVVDADTGRGVPLVELKTVNNVCYYTDSNGIVAFLEPGLMNQKVYFHVKSHGYEYPKDGFGYRGKMLEVSPGGSAEVKIKRLNVAERLYRLTGAGIYRDSLLLGKPVPTKQPVLNGQVFGSDSVITALYKGKIYWFWGDTNRPAYPLGNFHVPGATSLLPGKGGLDPEVGVDLDYFLADDGFAKATAKFPGKGPTWIFGLTVLKDKDQERLFGAYSRVQGFLTIYERGLVEWDDQKRQFNQVAKFDLKAPLHPGGHTFQRPSNGTNYVYYCTPYPLVRVPAEPEKLKKLENYEAFTCLVEGTQPAKGRIDRGPDGKVRYGWKKLTSPLSPNDQANLIKKGLLKPEEALLNLRDVDSGKAVTAHGGSVCFNQHRQRWLMIAVEAWGSTSRLGEIWYAEGDTPLGPWVYARKVVSHDRYSFYNPKQQPMFDKEGGRFIFFEGTYTHMFAANPEQTPYYDYNQIMYKLDLNDPRLVLPVPVYRCVDLEDRPAGLTLFVPRLAAKEGLPSFFALDRAKPGTVPVYQEKADDGSGRLVIGDQKPPLFFALPADVAKPPATTVSLYEFVHKDGKRRLYAVEGTVVGEDYARAERPLCRVWSNPLHVRLPLE